MKYRSILILGGSGFIGRHIAQHLCKLGYTVRVPVRRLHRSRHLTTLPTCEIIEADVHDAARLAQLMEGMDAVINLVGVLHSKPGRPFGPAFRQAHVELPEKIVAACRQSGVKRLLHVSALGAAPDAPSEYLRSKAAGEEAVRRAGPDIAWTLFRPSVVFGPGDRFLNLFAALSRSLPVIVLAGAQARFQPVYVGDVVEAMATSLDRVSAAGHTFELAGPTVYTLEELVRYAGKAARSPRRIIAVEGSTARFMAGVLEHLPGKLMSRDNLRSMERDNVASGEPLPFGIAPRSLESTAPGCPADASGNCYDLWRRSPRRV